MYNKYNNKRFKTMILGATALLLACSFNVKAETKNVTIYKCNRKGGNVRFQDRPCKSNCNIEVINMQVKDRPAYPAPVLSEHHKKTLERAHQVAMQQKEFKHQMKIANINKKTAEAQKPIYHFHMYPNVNNTYIVKQ